MRFDVVTIFPESLTSYLQASILKRAQRDHKIEIVVHQLREYATDKHQTTDDTPYGGGAGMVMKVEPFDRCLETIKNKESRIKNQESESEKQTSGDQDEDSSVTDHSTTNIDQKTRVILLSAKGKRFTQGEAKRLATYDRLILLCGRYEGVDERVAEHLADEELSIGDFVLTGGELPAMVVIDTVARLVPGVLGNEESAVTESFSDSMTREYPQYTKPEVYRDWAVPTVLLSGHHADIEAWRRTQSGDRRPPNEVV